MASGVRYVPNTDPALAFIAVRAAAIAETGAESLRDNIKSRIPDNLGPSKPGSPPHSPGPYRDSWHSTPAKRDGDSVVAWTFSLAKRADGSSLARALEYGDPGPPPLAPRPHIRSAETATAAELRRVLQGMRR